MPASRALAAATLLGLAAADTSPGSLRPRGLEHEDASSLVQVSLDSLAGLDIGEAQGGILAPRRKKRVHSEFPLESDRVGQKYHFVGSARFSINFAGFRIHCYDIAMYLNSTSPLWTQTAKRSRTDRIKSMLGDVMFYTIAHSKWVNNKNMAKFVDRLEYFAQRDNLTDYKEPIDEYRRAFLDGPRVTRNSHIVVLPSGEGVTPVVSGKDMGLIRSGILGRVVMEAYLGSESDLPEFRDKIFAQLSVGKPWEVGEPAEVQVEAGNPTWVIIILVIVILAIVGFLCGCLWWCCRRRAASPAGKEQLSPLSGKSLSPLSSNSLSPSSRNSPK